MKEPRDHIVLEKAERLYRTRTRNKIVSYMGFGVGKKEKEMMQSDVSAYVLKSKRNITPLLGSTSAATSLVLVHENSQSCPVDGLDALVDVGPCQALCTPP